MTLQLIDVPTPAGVRAVFTTRHGGVSQGQWAGLNIGASTGDDAAAVRETERASPPNFGLRPHG